jgi:hypothetical protein
MYNDTFEEFFSFSTEVDLIEKAGVEGDEPWIIKGIASVEVPDIEEETLIIKGMDTSFLENHGVINWNHKPTVSAILGEVVKAEKQMDESPAKLYIEGELYKDVDESIKARSLMKALQKSRSNRKMRLSVEGKALVRDKDNPKRVVKSIITNVALTMSPINKETWAVLAKGMCRHPEAESCLHCGYCFKKSATTESLSPVVKEDLEKDLTITCEGGDKKKKSGKKPLTKGDAVRLLVKSELYTPAAARQIIDFLFH